MYIIYNLISAQLVITKYIHMNIAPKDVRRQQLNFIHGLN